MEKSVMEKTTCVQEPDGWTPVDPSNRHVTKIAELAVEQHNNTAGTKLVFVALVNGSKLNCGGITYKLTVAARHECPFPPFPYPRDYEAIVYEDSAGQLEFRAFKKMFTPDGPESDEMDALSKLWKEMKELESTGVNAAGENTVDIDGLVWIIVDRRDPTVIEVGEFAVAERNRKTGTTLEFVGIVACLKLKIVAFNFYALRIRARDGDHNALVFQAPLGYKKLLFWMN